MKQIIKTLENIAIFLGLLNVLILSSCKDEIGEVTVPVTGVTLNLSDFKIQEGVEYHLIPTISPEDATNKQVTWSVSELSVEGCVEVDAQSGLIKPIKPGTALITVTTMDGNFTASCGIEVVKEVIPVESITIPDVYSIVKGDKYTFTPVIIPDAPSNRDLIWSLENVTPEGCLVIDSHSGEITAIEGGTATVNVIAADGRGAKASCDVTILSQHIEPTDIILSSSYIDIEVGGKAAVLKYEILPNDATNRNVIWEVVNEAPSGCVTLDNQGLVTGVKSGTATIRASIKDTELFDECIVTIIGPTPENGYEIIDGTWFIHNLDGLLNFKFEAELNPSVNAKLVKNIDLGTEAWIPICSESKPYSGHFDGNNKYISNLNIDEFGGTYKGLFAKVENAIISNVGIESGSIKASTQIGAIAGAATESSIVNCYNKIKIVTNVKNTYGGGIVGVCSNTNIIACYNSGEINKSGTLNSPYMGGIVGRISGNSNIIACYNRGKIAHTGGPYLGGIVGNLGNSTKMYGVYNVGVISRGNGWAIAGGGSSDFDTVNSIFGVYWAKDISGSKAGSGINTNSIKPDVSISVSSDEMNSQIVVDQMNQAIMSSGNEIAADYKYIVGTGDYKFPVLIRK